MPQLKRKYIRGAGNSERTSPDHADRLSGTSRSTGRRTRCQTPGVRDSATVWLDLSLLMIQFLMCLRVVDHHPCQVDGVYERKAIFIGDTIVNGSELLKRNWALTIFLHFPCP